MREKIKNFVDGKFFTTTVFVLILINTIVLGVETFTLTPELTQVLSTFNTICICIFVLEIILKLYAYGADFFKDPWNIFDTVIVLTSIMPMISFLSSMRALRIFRMFRALRALRMMKRLEKLRIIVQALLSALPSVAWVVVLLGIIYYVFAVIGTNLYASVSPEYFGTLWKSFYTLFQITMADDLGEVSRPIMEYSAGAVVYFVSFVALSTILVLNVIVGIVVDSVSEIKKSSQPPEAEIEKTTVESDDLMKEINELEQQLNRVKNLLASENRE